MRVGTCRVFTMMALNPGRNTRGVLSFVFDVSGRLVPPSLDGVAGFGVSGVREIDDRG